MNSIKIGQLGEDAACQFLKKKRYEILDRNYRQNFGEIDIVTKKGDTISFIEVKTRKNDTYGLPCEFVTKPKQERIIKTAYAYILEKALDMSYSFDVIEVYFDGEKVKKINHIHNAFAG